MRISRRGRANLRRLRELKDSHRGERCFVIGNGPSLRMTDMSRLRDEYTFGLNRIYLMFPELGFPTTFLVAVNRLVLEQVGQDVLGFPGPVFIPWSARTYLSTDGHANVRFLFTGCRPPGFDGDICHPLWSGETVTFVAMQLAFYMGFHRVVLIGVDHSFTTQGPAHQEVVSQGDDRDHFHPNYFGKGFHWQLPSLETSEVAYRMALSAFAGAGREILDATVGGKLEVFPKADYDTLF
jgi:hypothetical protein